MSEEQELVARALAPFIVLGLEGCAAAYDYPLLPARDKARIQNAATAVLAALQGSATLPGEAVTDAMIEVGCQASLIARVNGERTEEVIRAIYTAMRAAAPTAPVRD